MVPFQAIAHFQAARIGQAEATLERSLKMYPRFSSSYLVKAPICDATARRIEAQAALHRFREIEPETSLDLCVHRLSIYFRGIGRLLE